MNKKRVVIIVLIIGSSIGFIMACIVIAISNTRQIYGERTCDNITYYPNNEIICEINMKSPNDKFRIWEYKTTNY